MQFRQIGNDVSTESVVFKAKCQLPTQWAVFELYVFEEIATKKEHIALVLGKVDAEEKIWLLKPY